MGKSEDWQWSSFLFYGFRKTDSPTENLVDANPYYPGLGKSPQERKNSYCKNTEELMRENFLKNTREKLGQGVFGSDDFAKTTKDRLKTAFLGARGKPRMKREK